MSNFSIPNHLESTYRRAISILMIHQIPLDVDKVDSWISRIASVSYDQQFIQNSRRVAVKLVHDIDIQNIHNWREAIRQTSGGSRFLPLLYKEKIFNDEIDKLTVLISTLPERLSKDLQNLVSQARFKGFNEERIFLFLKKKYSSLLFNRVRLLAQTDPHRVNSSLTEARAIDFDLPCFIWETSKDEVVRLAHKRMDGVLCFWSNLPSPESLIGNPSIGQYAPGGIPGCRCRAVSVLSIDDLFTSLRSKIKVFDNGIRLMTKSQFMGRFMALRSGGSILNEIPAKNTQTPGDLGAVPGGNSGCVISPAPKLGLSAYQEAKPVNESSKGGD